MNGCYYSFMLNERSYCYTRNSLHSKSSCVKLLPWYIPSKFTKLNQTCTKWQEQTLSIQWKETQRSFAFSRNKIRYSLLCLIQKCIIFRSDILPPTLVICLPPGRSQCEYFPKLQHLCHPWFKPISEMRQLNYRF
jgi:hypothetical protein